MTDDHVHRWLADDPLLNAVLIVVATSVTVALTSRLLHHVRTDSHQRLPDDSPFSISAALASFPFSVARTVPPPTQQQSLPVPPVEADQEGRKSTRSKERRRRGKDPFRDLLKGGKKSKALLKALKPTEHDHSPLSADTLSNSSAPPNDTASSTSRSPSPEPVGDALGMDRLAPRLGVESDDGSARSITPNGSTSSLSAAISVADMSEHDSQTDGILVTDADTEANTSSASTAIPHASEEPSSSPPVSESACAEVRTPPSRDSHTEYTSGSCAKLVRARTKLRLSRMDPSVKSCLLPATSPPLPDSVAMPSDSIRPIAPCPSLLITPSTSSSQSTDGAGPSTPTNSREPTPPPRSPSMSEDPSQEESAQSLDEGVASAHMQLASMRNALEAARLREEQLRSEAEQASKERDELRWGWSEDANVWRRREAELQGQIHHLMQQLQAYAAVASFQAQQASSAFSSPTSPHPHTSPRLQHHPLVPFPLPPAMQPQHSASPPAHVQALLASTPMLNSHPAGFAVPHGGPYPGPGFGMSPLWSGLGLCVPNRDARHNGRRTPDSSASGSSSRGRRRRQRAESASDESSLGEWEEGPEDGSGDEAAWEEEEDIFRNNVLADAILKRPESIRGLGKPSRGRPPMQGTGVAERMDTLKDPASEKLGFVPPVVATSAAEQ